MKTAKLVNRGQGPRARDHRATRIPKFLLLGHPIQKGASTRCRYVSMFEHGGYAVVRFLQEWLGRAWLRLPC